MYCLDSHVITRLIDILDQEARLYDSILRLSKNKTNIIVEGKVAELEGMVKIEQSLILQMGKLESEREGIIESIAMNLSLEPSEITISELTNCLQKDQADKLKLCQQKMTEILNQLKNTNEINSKLIKNSLDYIDFSINIISAVDTGSNNYSNSGHVSNSKKRSFFDVKL